MPPAPSTSEDNGTTLGSTVIFALCVVFTDGLEKWDNHAGENYSIRLVKRKLGEEDEDDELLNLGSQTVPPNQCADSRTHFLRRSDSAEDERFLQLQQRRMSPDYNFYNETSQFYW